MTLVEQIVQREIEAVIVYESDTVVAFMDHDPINRGHLLVCPKQPFRNFVDVPEELLLDVMRVAKTLYHKLTEKYQPDGISFIQCNGDFNDLDHFHLHIFPRKQGDGFGWTCSEIGLQTQTELQAEADGLIC